MTPAEPNRIRELAMAFRQARALMSAVELEVFTALAERELDAEGLAERLSISRRGARDFFDALVALQLLERGDTGLYRNSAEADLYLDRAKASYIGDELRHAGVRLYRHWDRLTDALKTGLAHSEAEDGSLYPGLYRQPAAAEAFLKA